MMPGAIWDLLGGSDFNAQFFDSFDLPPTNNSDQSKADNPQGHFTNCWVSKRRIDQLHLSSPQGSGGQRVDPGGGGQAEWVSGFSPLFSV